MTDSIFDLPFRENISNLQISRNYDDINVEFTIKDKEQIIGNSNNKDSEHKIQNEIMLALSKHNCTIFRANVGSVKTADGRWFKTGLPNGFPDLVGFRWVDGKIFFIEVKNATGKPRPDQIIFHKMLESHQIIHGIARSVQDALMIVDGGLTGYGYN